MDSLVLALRPNASSSPLRSHTTFASSRATSLRTSTFFRPSIRAPLPLRASIRHSASSPIACSVWPLASQSGTSSFAPASPSTVGESILLPSSARTRNERLLFSSLFMNATRLPSGDQLNSLPYSMSARGSSTRSSPVAREMTRNSAMPRIEFGTDPTKAV